MDVLLARGTLNEGDETYLDALSSLVGAYEDEHHAIEPVPASWSGSSFPGNESPAHGIDQFLNDMDPAATKYLNFGEERSGLIITNSEGPVTVDFMRLTGPTIRSRVSRTRTATAPKSGG